MSRNGNLFVPLGGYGRNINHDPASRAFRAARFAAAPGAAGVTPKTVMWTPRIAPLTQGDLGRCVPTAGTAMLTCDPFWPTLPLELRKMLARPETAEQFSIQAYRDVTKIDPFPGTWEPDDTGSDGLSLWKLYRDRGYVGGSEHVMSVEDAHAAIQKGPYPIGVSWLSEMDGPNTEGIVRVNGYARGGHEVLLYGYDADRDLWWCRNSWGAEWGRNGDFAFDTPGYLKLMSMQADGIVMTPLSAPAPKPTPQPVWGDDLETFPYEEMDTWVSKALKKVFRSKYETIALEAYTTWRG